MSIDYFLLDVFADKPFQGTQIPVVVLEESAAESFKISVAGEFRQTETVFIEPNVQTSPISVYNHKNRTKFGAHTTLAAAYAAHTLGLCAVEGKVATFKIESAEQSIATYIDIVQDGYIKIQFSRSYIPKIDLFTPTLDNIAKAIGVEAQQLASKVYQPMVVTVDHPTLILPLNTPAQVATAVLNIDQWPELLSGVYTDEMFLFAPGSISGTTDFHGRLLNPHVARGEFPPIGKVIPEFIAYLCAHKHIAKGTHTFSIDRGSVETRKSVIHAEMDKQAGEHMQCRIGGNVIQIGQGRLLLSTKAVA